jgi:hypothetical protein
MKEKRGEHFFLNTNIQTTTKEERISNDGEVVPESGGKHTRIGHNSFIHAE